MSKTRHVGQRMLACVIAAFVAVGVALTAIAPTTAYADEAAIREVGEGVFKFNWRYDGQNYSRGSCFLINEDHVLTCWHCCMFSPAERKALELAGVDVRDLVKKFTYTVTIYRDVQKEATLVNFSEEEDWAIFKLKEKVGDSHALTFRDSQDVQAAETVWAVGFPANSDLKVINTYRPDDVTIKQGTVSKPEGTYAGEVEDGWVYRGNYLQTTAPLSGGDSGGPMVDDNGYVLGISEMGIDNYYFCIANNSIMKALDRLGIAYDKKGGTIKTDTDGKNEDGKADNTEGGAANVALNVDDIEKAISDAEGKTENASAYTEDSYNAMKAALSEARDAAKLKLDNPEDGDELKEKQETIDKAAGKLRGAIDGLQQKPEEPAGPSAGAIAGIVAAVAAAIAGIVALIAHFLKKGKQNAEAGAPQAAGYNAASSAPSPVPTPAPKKAAAPVDAAPGTTVFDEESAGTTVLDDDAPPTDVLTEDVNGGVLTRMSTNEKIDINRSELSLGRERRSVDYCLEGNTNIGRVHARILVRNGQTYIVDNNSTNGTFVNNAKLRPGVEQQLKSGDIIRLADEKFRYNK